MGFGLDQANLSVGWLPPVFLKEFPDKFHRILSSVATMRRLARSARLIGWYLVTSISLPLHLILPW
jgi:hypothetical protein